MQILSYKLLVTDGDAMLSHVTDDNAVLSHVADDNAIVSSAVSACNA